MESLKSYSRQIAVCLSMILLMAVLLTATSIPVNAAVSYKGAGTSKDPYLVETAEQLQGISEKLSAHYKLANTIDLKGKSFTPIGNLQTSFTGSFVCDKGSDGFPLYAIKNLSVTIAVKPYLGEKKNRWEAGLFGSAEGASFKNIYVLDGNVVNKNEGHLTGSVADGDFRPGMNELAAGILAAHVKNTNVSGCMTSGSVSGATNWCGGLIGRAYDSMIEYCYSTANVDSTGVFGAGGLLGDCSSTVNFCFATGNVKGTTANPSRGGLIGQSARTFYPVTNCYSTGKVNASTGASFAGYSGGDGKQSKDLEFTNCYTISVLEGKTKAQTIGDSKINGCILDTVLGEQVHFSPVSKAELLNKFKNLPGWVTTGVEYPQIKDIQILTSARAAQYVPGQVTEAPKASQTSSGGTSTAASAGTTQSQTQSTASGTGTASAADGTESGGGEAETETAVKANASEVTKMIEALPVIDDISINDVDAVVKAKKAYDALSDDDKMTVDQQAIDKIMTIAVAIQPHVLKKIKTAIESWPEVEKLTEEHKQSVLDTYELYEFLEENSKSALLAELKDKLIAAKAKVDGMQGADETGGAAASAKVTTPELILIILLSAIICAAAAVNIIFTVKSFKLKKRALR